MKNFQNTHSDHITNNQHLRKLMRRRRLELAPYTRRKAGQSIVRQLRRAPFFVRSKKIGVYLDAFGEVPTRNVIQLCFKLKKIVYLPVVGSFNQPLSWSRITRHQLQNQRMIKHRFGMKQPPSQRGVSVKSLDCLLMPLVAFDMHGHRLGMGGGFYDRTLSHCVNTVDYRHLKPIKPWRVGVAYDFQQVHNIDSQAWDVSIHAVVTPTRYQRF
jgi:5-formyltetrahydrofolate cyclo-ligase